MPHLSCTISPTTSNTLLPPLLPLPSSSSSSDVTIATTNHITTTTPPPPTSSAIFNSTSNINNASMQPIASLQSLPPLNLSAINGEEISTIFVVGFPEDMLEREFQNMFIFSPGFEAATLKIPNNKDQEDELMINNSSSSNNGNNALTTNDNSEGTSNNGGIIDGNEANGTNNNNKAAYNNNGMRKQIIGFAKFRTRMEALEARDIISGRKVDAEKGSVLKAEMAKKNLHTKRGLSLEPLQQQQVLLGFPTQALSPPINPPSYSNVQQQQQQQQSQTPSTISLTSPITSSALASSSSTAPQASSSSSLSATTKAIRLNTSANARNHAAYEAFYSVPSSDNIDLFTSVTSPTTGDYLYSDLFSPTVATGSSSSSVAAFKDSILFSPGSNRTPSSSSSFDLRTSSVGDIFNSTSCSSSSSSTLQHSSTPTRFPLSSSLSSSSTAATATGAATIRGSGFNSNTHRLSSKHIFDMEKDSTYLSKSTPTNHFFPLHDNIIHPTSLTSSASSLSSSSSSFSAHHHPLYSQSSTNTFNHISNSGATTTVNNINGLSSVMEETGDDSAPTTPPESLDIENRDGYDLFPWQSHQQQHQQQQQHRASFVANKDPVAELHHRVNGLAINTNTTNANLMKGIPNNNNDSINQLTSPATNNTTFAQPTATMMMNGTTNNDISNSNGTSGFLRNYNGNGTIIGSTNPADQNPPCNTLYVGNLPPNTNEDELKQMFSKCFGYKRLSFRHKANGPMCFVEFIDVTCATQALQDLYGNPLSNSIKGGIRLSFSKNPLGVRQQQPPPLGGPNNIPFTATPPPPPPTVTSNMNFGFMNGGLAPMNYTRRGSMAFDPQLS